MLEYARIWLELKYDCRAVTALEYGLIAGIIFVACAALFTELGTNLRAQLSTVHGLFPD